MAPQRKFRNAAERQAIVDGIVQQFSTTGLPPIKQFQDILDEFKSSENGRQFDGRIELDEFGVAIEYVLPGRRICQPGARVTKLNK